MGPYTVIMEQFTTMLGKFANLWNVVICKICWSIHIGAFV